MLPTNYYCGARLMSGPIKSGFSQESSGNSSSLLKRAKLYCQTGSIDYMAQTTGNTAYEIVALVDSGS